MEIINVFAAVGITINNLVAMLSAFGTRHIIIWRVCKSPAQTLRQNRRMEHFRPFLWAVIPDLHGSYGNNP